MQEYFDPRDRESNSLLKRERKGMSIHEKSDLQCGRKFMYSGNYCYLVQRRHEYAKLH